jgi:hypothetical protein
MSVATSTAIAIGLGGASLVTGAIGAHKAASASKEAAKQQAASAQQALAVQQQMYQQTRGDLAPYRQYGAGALAAGHQLMGLPTPAAEPAMMPLSQVIGQRPTPTGTAVPRGSLVLLRAPNGQTQQVPADQVDHYLARGATRG